MNVARLGPAPGLHDRPRSNALVNGCEFVRDSYLIDETRSALKGDYGDLRYMNLFIDRESDGQFYIVRGEYSILVPGWEPTVYISEQTCRVERIENR